MSPEERDPGLLHDMDGRIDPSQIRDTVRTDLPPLIAAIEHHLSEHS